MEKSPVRVPNFPPSPPRFCARSTHPAPTKKAGPAGAQGGRLSRARLRGLPLPLHFFRRRPQPAKQLPVQLLGRPHHHVVGPPAGARLHPPGDPGMVQGLPKAEVNARERRARPAPREGAFPGPACAGFPYGFTSSAAIRSQPSSSPSSSWGVPTTTWWVHRPGRGSTRPEILGWSRGSRRPKVTVR